MTSLQDVAGEGASVIAQVQKMEPWIEAVLPFIPGAGVAVPFVHEFAPLILTFAARALADIASNNNGDLPSALIELLQHNTKGQPNSGVLSQPIMPKADTP